MPPAPEEPGHGLALSRADVEAAAARLRGEIVRTPTLRVPALDAIAGARVWIKCECLQRIGAFKARGALHAVGRLDPAVRARGVVTYSSGNHAQAVALAAQRHGISATIAMPEDAPGVKVAGVRALGATIIFAGLTSDDRRLAAEAVVERTGATMVPPFDHPDIIAGQGTATLELLEDVAAAGGRLDALLVPVGGGGLIAGALLACEGAGVRVYSVEPAGCDALARSVAAGERVEVQPGPTLADGLRPVKVGALNLAVIAPRLAGCLLVDDAGIGPALVRLLLHAKVLAEPSGAAPLAPALQRGVPGDPADIGVIVSGGNVEPALVARLVECYGAEA
jgi:threonine dehydratase